ncbi:MAG: hypothetical protein ABH871_07635 [Pseudomonadota bacterium]
MVIRAPINVTPPPGYMLPEYSMMGMALPAGATLGSDLYQIGPKHLTTTPSILPPSIFRHLGNSGFNNKGPEQNDWLKRAGDFFKNAYHGLVQLLDGSDTPLFAPQMLELAGTGMVMPAFAIGEEKLGHVSMMAMDDDAPPPSVIPNLDISRQQLLKRLTENEYKKKDIEIVEAVFGNLQGIPANLQQRSIRVAFKMIELNASVYGVATALCLHASKPRPRGETPKKIQGILNNKQQLESLPCNWSNDVQVDYFRSLMFLMAEDMDSFLLLAAEDLIDLEQATELPSDSPDKMTKKAQRAFLATSWILKYLNYGDDSGKLEDLALLHLDPKAYEEVERRLEKINGMDRAASLGKLRKIAEDVNFVLEIDELEHQIKYRVKRIASAKRRDEIKGNNNDTNGIRIILDSNVAESCYAALFAIRKFFEDAGWKEQKDLDDDYISRPKDNGYQSLHIGYIDASGYVVEIQIRTKEMDRKAEIGSAAHISYKTGEKTSATLLSEDHVAQQLFDEKRKRMIDAGVYFVYDETNDDLLRLVTGSPNRQPTVLDAAFARSIQEGLRAIRGFVEDKNVKLDAPLFSGQRVRVETGSRAEVNGRRGDVATFRAKALLAIAAKNMHAVMDGNFNLQTSVSKGKEDFKNIVSQIEAELHRLYGPRFKVGKPKHSFSLKRLYNRMGFDDEEMFYAMLAALPEGTEKDKFEAQIKTRIKTDGILYSHNRKSLEIISTGEGSLLKQLFANFSKQRITLETMDISRIPGSSPYYMTRFSIKGEFPKSFLSDLEELSNYITHSESRLSSSLDITVHIRRDSSKPEIAMAIVNSILGLRAEIKACSIPKANQGEIADYTFRIQLPQGLSKKRGALRLATAIGNIQGTSKIVIV